MDTLGIVESKSIAAGVELADVMVKAASVELVRAATVCAGRYMVFVSGDRRSVETAVNAARGSGRSLSGDFVISNIAPEVVAALKKSVPAEEGEALGVVECRTASSGVAAADAAVKQADVRLPRLVTGQGIHGKSYFVLAGETAAVTDAVNAARAVLGKDLVETVVIPRPDPAVAGAVTGVR